MKNNNISNIGDKCTGCGLCSTICPFGAIEMKSNEEGFLYPYINEEKCKNCGICLKKCVVNNNKELKENYNEKCLMVISKDNEIYNNSASGGFATTLAKYVIEKLNGVVYGCNLDSVGNVKHIRIDNYKELYKLQDSKYVQSNIIDVFSQIKEEVKNRKVLFVGTPCQVNAIKNSIDTQNMNNLITCDLICHGVPSPGIFKKYFNYLQKKYKGKITKYNFRNKTSFDKCGFRGKLEINNKKKYFYIKDDPFYNDFINEQNYRKSCYQCQYKEQKRVGDFTIGDVASWELYYDFYPEKAPSLVICNNSNAESIFNEIKDRVDFKEISLDKEKKLNAALSRQTNYPKERDNVYKKYENIDNIVFKNNISVKEKVKIFLKSIIPFKYRIRIKKIRNRKK